MLVDKNYLVFCHVRGGRSRRPCMLACLHGRGTPVEPHCLTGGQPRGPGGWLGPRQFLLVGCSLALPDPAAAAAMVHGARGTGHSWEGP